MTSVGGGEGPGAVGAAPTPDAAADAVAAVVRAHPGVARLDGGPFGTVASYLRGRRVVGVRLPAAPGAAAEVVLVARAGTPLPRLAVEIGAAVRTVLGDVPVDVTVADVVPAAGPGGVAATRGGRSPVA